LNKAASSWGAITIAEDLQGDVYVTTPIAKNGLGFDGQWDDNGYYQLHGILTSKNDNDRNMANYQSVRHLPLPRSLGTGSS
jgi:1,4-alpha-glucan branching enzyme